MPGTPQKRLLIAMDTMMCGGIEKSVLALLRALPRERYEVTLLLLTRTGEFLPMIPSWIRVREVPLSPCGRAEWVLGRRAVLREALRRGRLVRAGALLGRRLWCRLAVPPVFWPVGNARAMMRGMRLDDVEYDCAIAYHNIEQAVLVADHIRARCKITWFHTELSTLPVSPRAFWSVYQRFDIFAAASEAVVGELKRFFPEEVSKIRLFPLVIERESFLRLAGEGAGFVDEYGGIRILSVGRLALQKGFDLAIDVHAKLLQAGFPHRWYVLGQGSEEAALRELIRKHGVEASFRLLGVQVNPYPYFAQCDLYVQPSRYEGYCLTVAEARAFAKPIVCTDFAGAREQIQDGVTGRVVPCEPGALFDAVKDLLAHPERRQEFSGRLAASWTDTRDQIRGLCRVIDGEENRN